MNPEVAGLIVLVGLFILNGVLSSAKAAFANVHRPTLQKMASRGNKRAERALAVAEDSSRLLTTAKLGSVVINFLMAGLVAIFVVPRFAGVIANFVGLENGLGLSYVIVMPLAALVLYLLSSLIPESVVAHNAERWALVLIGPMRLAKLALLPAVAGLMWVGGLLAKMLGDDDKVGIPVVTEEEIMTLVDAGEEEGAIELDEKQMIASIFRLDNTTVREVMVPRIDIVSLSADASLQEALDLTVKAGHSRIPVYKENIDSVAGLLYAKDLLDVWRQGKEDVDLLSILRPAVFTPESKKVDALLEELQQKMVHLAIVVDEYGGTAGVVTLEDIVEEIVGEIQDEYDSEAAIYRAIGEGEYEFDARIDMDDLNEVLDSKLATDQGDTLGGFIYSQLGKVPAPGEKVLVDGLQMEVLSVDDQRIETVRVLRVQPGEQAESAVAKDG